MALAFKKLRVYARLTLMGAVALVVILVLVVNRNNRATVWFFHKFQDVNVVWLLVVTGLGSILAAWVTRGFFRIMGEYSRLRQEQDAARRIKEQEATARELAEQERRIDAKLKASLSGQDEGT